MGRWSFSTAHGDRRGLAGAGGAEEDDVLLPRRDPLLDVGDRRGLVSRRGVVGDDLERRNPALEIGHGPHVDQPTGRLRQALRGRTRGEDHARSASGQDAHRPRRNRPARGDVTPSPHDGQEPPDVPTPRGHGRPDRRPAVLLRPARPGSPGGATDDLDGSWRLARRRRRRRAAPLSAATPVTLAVDGREVSGRAACNGTRLERDGDRLRLGQVMVTEMACPPAVMTLEQRYLSALGAVDAVAVGERRLVLTGADVRLEFDLDPVRDADLVGTAWSLESSSTARPRPASPAGGRGSSCTRTAPSRARRAAGPSGASTPSADPTCRS